MGDNNREFLRSLSDKALAEEIKYGGWLSEHGRHKRSYRQDYEEAKAERARRKGGRDSNG
jgi:hypothetical protein